MLSSSTVPIRDVEHPERHGAGELSPEFKPLPPDATAAEKDRHWYETTYQGDRVPQLTVRAVLTGAVIGMLMSIGNIYINMKVGFSVGVTITACVLSYLGWGLLRALSGMRLTQLSILENACMVSTASATGFSAGTSVAIVFAALMVLDPQHRHQPWWLVLAFTFVTAAMGLLLAIPMKRHLINQEQLPFPSATATALTLRSLYGRTRDALRKAYFLVGALVTGVVSGVLSTAEDQFGALGRFFAWMRAHVFDVHLPDQLPQRGFGLLGGKPLVGFGFEPGVLVIGVGMIVGLRVSVSMLVASSVLYAFVAPWLHGMDVANAGVADYVASIPTVGGGALYHPLRWAVWGGASVLVFASLTSLALQWRAIAAAFASLGNRAASDDRAASQQIPSGGKRAPRRQTGELARALDAIEIPGSWMLAGLIPLTIAMVAIQVLAFGVAWWAGVAAVALCLLLALVISRVFGETDVSPLGAMGKLMQVVFAVISPAGTVGAQASVVQNVMSAGIAVNSGAACADLLSDLKTGYLLGANPRRQFVAQLVGVLFGTAIAVPAWFLMIPNYAALERYPNPAAQVWVAVARALTSGLSTLPSSVAYAVAIGAAIGVALPLLEKALPKARPYLPSAAGIGLGWVVPFSVSLSFAIGACLAALWRRVSARSAESYSSVVASGLIAGESIVKALLAMLATAIGLA